MGSPCAPDETIRGRYAVAQPQAILCSRVPRGLAYWLEMNTFSLFTLTAMQQCEGVEHRFGLATASPIRTGRIKLYFRLLTRVLAIRVQPYSQRNACCRMPRNRTETRCIESRRARWALPRK